VSTEHDLDHRFDYLFEPLTVVDADLADEDTPQQRAGGGSSKVVPVALVASAVTAAVAIVALLQWPARSNPAIAPTAGDTQSTPSSTQSVAPDSPLVETPVASAVESRPQPQIAPSAGAAPGAGPQPPATAPSVAASRSPALPSTRAPISVAPSSRTPLPYPNPNRDPSRPHGGLLGGGGVL
jgi:hypothetical protein